MNAKFSVIILTALSFVSKAEVESSRGKYLLQYPAPEAAHAKVYRTLEKEDFIHDPPVTTVEVVNRTIQILGALATVGVFIIKPIIYAIFASAGRPIFNRRILSPPNVSNNFSGRGILDRDRCIERISCEIANYSNRRNYIRRFAESVFPVVFSHPDGITSRIFKTLAKQGDACYQYSCDPLGFLIRLFIYKIDWNTILKS